jgi:hypothetical protein
MNLKRQVQSCGHLRPDFKRCLVNQLLTVDSPLTQSLLQAAFRAHLHFRRLGRDLAEYEASIAFRPSMMTHDVL